MGGKGKGKRKGKDTGGAAEMERAPEPAVESQLDQLCGVCRGVWRHLTSDGDQHPHPLRTASVIHVARKPGFDGQWLRTTNAPSQQVGRSELDLSCQLNGTAHQVN